MKLVRMPRELLTVEAADLPSLGVPAGLAEAAARFAAHDGLSLPSAVVLGPRAANTAAVLMVLARKVGIALRDRNIRLRDGGDKAAPRLRLSYLPGALLPEVLASDADRRTLASDAAVFLQDLDDAPCGDDAGFTASILELLHARERAALRTFISAAPTSLPDALLRACTHEHYVVLRDAASGAG